MSFELHSGGYTMTAEECDALLSIQLIKWNGLRTEKPYAIRVLDLGEDQQLAQAIEAKVFRRSSGDRAKELMEAWYLYEAGNFAIVLLANADESSGQPARVVGTIRVGCGVLPRDLRTVVHLTEPEPWGFKSVQTLQENMNGYSWSQVWDISTLVVDPQLKQSASGRKAVLALFHALFQLMEAQNTKMLVGIVAERVYRELDTLGIGLVPLGDLAKYYASMARPFAVHVGRLPQTLGRKDRYRRMLLEGVGLDDFDIQVAH